MPPDRRTGRHYFDERFLRQTQTLTEAQTGKTDITPPKLLLKKIITMNNEENLFECRFGSSINVPHKVQNQRVLNFQSGIQKVGKPLNTIPKPFSFEYRELFSTKHQCVMGTEPQWLFKARPAAVLKRKPFVPKHEKKYTEPKNVFLNTEKRAHEWMKFELEVKQKLLLNEKCTRMRQEELKKKELDFIKKMRQGTVHKPEPIKKFKPVVIKKSVRPVTIPKTPTFSTR